MAACLSGGVDLHARGFHSGQDELAQVERFGGRLEPEGAAVEPGQVDQSGDASWREQKVVVGDGLVAPGILDEEALFVNVDLRGLSSDHIDAGQGLSEGHGRDPGVERSHGHVGQQRLIEHAVGVGYERDIRLSSSEPPTKLAGGKEPSEAAADNHDGWSGRAHCGRLDAVSSQ
jgi:hypothetical protein